MLQDRDSQKTEWIGRCIEELRSDTWVLPALKQIKEICSLFYEVYFLVRVLHFYPGDHCQCSLLILFCSTFWTVCMVLVWCCSAHHVVLQLYNHYCLYSLPCKAPQNYSHTQRNPHVYYRHEVINQLQQTHSLVKLVADNLATYMQKVHTLMEGRIFDFPL